MEEEKRGEDRERRGKEGAKEGSLTHQFARSSAYCNPRSCRRMGVCSLPAVSRAAALFTTEPSAFIANGW